MVSGKRIGRDACEYRSYQDRRVAAARSYHTTQNNRYLTFDPNNSNVNGVALEVELTAGPGTLGVLGWVGAPDPTSGLSRVVGTAHYATDWPGVIQLADCEIVTGATYEIRATDDGVNFSTPFAVSTAAAPTALFWGDVVGMVDIEGRWTGPNGVTNFMDVQAEILGFQTEFKGSDVSWLDVHPQCPNGSVNFDDISQIILAFQGDPYPFADPADCTTCPSRSAGNIDFRLVADDDLIDPEDQVVFDVHVEPATDVGVYEMSLEVLGGTTGSLDLTGLNINKARSDYIFGTSAADAVDNVGKRLGAATPDGTGVTVTTANDYLGTFTYIASEDASGVFEVRVRSINEAYLSDSNVDPIGTSPGDSIFIGVNVDCVIDEHCEDFSECTDDACVNNVCQNTNNNCDDANDCTSDTCNVDVCEHSNEPKGTPCEDGQFCTTPDTCNSKGVCIGGPNDPCLSTEICFEFLDDCILGT